MEVHCVSCGMPLENKADFGAKTDKGPVCKYCTGPNGKVKSCKEIFEGGVNFFVGLAPGTDRKLAERVTRRNMKNLPYWKGKNEECLKGEVATDKEFQAALAKL